MVEEYCMSIDPRQLAGTGPLEVPPVDDLSPQMHEIELDVTHRGAQLNLGCQFRQIHSFRHFRNSDIALHGHYLDLLYRCRQVAFFFGILYCMPVNDGQEEAVPLEFCNGSLEVCIPPQPLRTLVLADLVQKFTEE